MKNVMISGGASGIGLATVQKFLKSGYQVFVLDKQAMPINDTNMQCFQCDLSEPKQIEQAVNEIVKIVKTIDALVCSAGIHFSANLENSSEADYEKVMATNFKSAFFLTKCTIPLMKAHGGAIVFVGSDQNLVGKKNSALYGASKAALGSLTKTTALDYASYNIRANLVAAGTIDTPLYRNAIQRFADKSGINIKEIEREEAEAQPLGRIGKPEEVASLIHFLCTDETAFITGAIMPIDGGYTAK